MACVLLLAAHTTSAQSNSWATLSAPPTGIAPPGDVLRAGRDVKRDPNAK